MLENDQSFTCLGGKKILKSAEIFEVLGSLDELVCQLGAVRVFNNKKTLSGRVIRLQEELVNLGGWLSGEGRRPSFGAQSARLEKEIKLLKDPSLKKFTKPGSSQTSVFLHLARVSARHLERKVVGLNNKRNQSLINYLNRLSLFLFWLAVKEEKNS